MATSPANLLIVDDTPENLRVLEGFLAGEGHRVRAAPGGKLALATAAKHPPDLMLLDINMPEMDGLEVCRRFKADPALREVPILFLSAYTDLEHKVKAFEVGGADYVTKPFQWEEVRARVNTQLGLARARAELLERNAALAKALAELKEAQVRLVEKEKMASLGVLTAGVAHEINNPVNFIVGGLSALRHLTADARRLLEAYAAVPVGDQAALAAAHALRDQVGLADLLGGQEELLGSMAVGAQRATEIVKGLRTFARKDETVAKPMDLAENLAAALMILGQRLRPVEVVRSFGFRGQVMAHAGQLNQVFVNLLANAADAVEAAHPRGGGRIEVVTAAAERGGRAHAMVEVRDNGPGIGPEVRAHLFEPFFTTKEVGRGTGLGLAIVRGIADHHHALIEVDSAPGAGACFRLLLPLHDDGAASAAPAREARHG